MQDKARGEVCLGLLGGFSLTWQREGLVVPLSTQRLLALLALENAGIQRAVAGERLWPERPARRASANLRSALWGSRQAGAAELIDCVGHRLRLSSTVRVDLHEVSSLLEGPPGASPGTWCALTGQDRGAVIAALNQELLTDWSEDWILFHRDRWDEVRLHALEDLARWLRADQQYLAALETALTAASIDVVRETPHRIIMEIHIAEGNVARAISYYQRYRVLLQRELGIAPSTRMSDLMRSLLAP